MAKLIKQNWNSVEESIKHRKEWKNISRNFGEQNCYGDTENVGIIGIREDGTKDLVRFK